MAKKRTKTKTLIVPVITKNELAKRVEHLVLNDSLKYIEAIMQVCEELDLEPEDIGKIVGGPLKDKVEGEAQRLNILPKPNSLFDL